MTEKESYAELSRIYKAKEEWTEKVEFVASFLESLSSKLCGKSLWILGEIGLTNPRSVSGYVGKIARLSKSEDTLIRERSMNALGRIGRADFSLVEPYWTDMFDAAEDSSPEVRLSFIWASENIATQTPEVYAGRMEIFKRLLSDENVRVRIEAPEIFRVIGKRLPALVLPYIDVLKEISENDVEKVVKIHAVGAIRATEIVAKQ